MTALERTRQQLDPVGAFGSRPLSIILPCGAFLYGLAMTLRTTDQISNGMLAFLALVWLATASATVVVATSPTRAPFTQSSHLVTQLFALGAAALCVASQWGSNVFIQDDFGPMSLGILLLALGPYRPATELATGGVLSAIFVGFVTLLEVPQLHTTVPPVSYVLVGMTPILALAFASSSYSGGLVDSLERWRARAIQSATQRTNRLRAGITRTVQRDRVMILSQDVLPFFSSVLEHDTLSQEDRERARDIADSIRSLMVAEADRTWLEVVAGDDGVSKDQMSGSVVDKAGRASWMMTDQRTVLRAIIVAILEEPRFVRGSLKVTIAGTGPVCHGVLAASVDDEDFLIRSTLAPYFAVMRIVFSTFKVDFRRPSLTLRFSYEQR
ncbi:MAG: hypothetical protein KF801_01505 [Cryobacterium sp.]|nr:hypothetical protein [Cryobacterium sp.]